MLSYQHSYHAGNFADVHKHVGLVLLLRHLQRKPAPICYVDCHAGRGIYDLQGEEAQKTREAEGGILKLVSAEGLPADVRDYLDLVASVNPAGGVRYYPGSAALARAALRAGDRAILLELHPQEYLALKRSVRGDKRIGVHARDCYEGLPALLPPAIRRGLVLIDPSYEVKDEFDDVVPLLLRALERWPNAICVLWYPVLAARRHERLLQRIGEHAPARTLASEIRLPAGAVGLQGSGLVVVNTPWQFDERLGAAMRAVVPALGIAGPEAHSLRWLTPP